jgi:hypothetical protein
MAKFTTLSEALSRVPRSRGLPLFLPTEYLPAGTKIDVETKDMLNQDYSNLLEDPDRAGLLILTAGQAFHLIALESWPSFVAVGLDKVPNGTVCKILNRNMSPEATFQANVAIKGQNYTIETGSIITLEVEFEGQQYLFEETK